MKKILLILMLSYSFAFSVTYHSSWDSLISYQSSNPDSYGNLNINTGSRDSLNNSTFAIPTADISTNGSCPSSVYKNLGGPAYYIFSFNYQSSDGLTCYYSYNYYYQYYDTYPACISPEVFDLDSRTCLVPSPTCDPDTEVLNPDTNLCESKCSGYNNLLLSDGTCTNCNYNDLYLDAKCNCEAISSSYTPKPTISFEGTLSSYPDLIFEQTLVTCDNDVKFSLVYPIENNTTENNTTVFYDDNVTFDSNYTNPIPTTFDDLNSTSDIVESIYYSNQFLSSIDNSLVSVSNKIDTTNQNLDNISNKIDTTNQNLSDISNKIDTTNQKLGDLNGDNFTGDLSTDNFTDFLSNLTTDLSNIDNTFNDLQTTFENGFTTNSISSGSDPIFSTVAFNKTIELDLCSSFSAFKPFLSFLLTVTFLILSARVFWAGFKLDN